MAPSDMLGSFLKIAQNKGLVSLERIPDDDEDGFRSRYRSQKYVYLAKYFGLDLKYNYNKYNYGPYSPELADECFEISKEPENAAKDQRLPASFDSEEFFKFVGSKSDGWLEIATTILDLVPLFPDEEELVDHVEYIKYGNPKEYIRHVLYELRRRNLISQAVSQPQP